MGDPAPGILGDAWCLNSPPPFGDDDCSLVAILAEGVWREPQRWMEERYAQAPDDRREGWSEIPEKGYGSAHHEQ